MTSRGAVLAAFLAALPVVAAAQPVSGLYVGAAAGMDWLMPQSLLNPGSSPAPQGDTSPRPGFVGEASIGFGFGNGVRAEIEGNWRSNKIRGIGGAGPGSGGAVDTTGMMVNALFDADIGAGWIYPYIGAGVGYGWQSASNIHTGTWRVNGTQGNFAYQAMAGAAFPIAAVPGLALTAEYRFFAMLDTVQNVSGTSSAMKISSAYDHSVLLGARYEFNAAPAPLPAVPAALARAEKSYLIFFDWDQATLTDRARAILKEAAATAKSTTHMRVEVNGHADASGKPQHNRDLSLRRAQAAAGELVRNGVAKNEIVIRAFGDTMPLVPAGLGLRAPQNRRVEIVVR